MNQDPTIQQYGGQPSQATPEFQTDLPLTGLDVFLMAVTSMAVIAVGLLLRLWRRSEPGGGE